MFPQLTLPGFSLAACRLLARAAQAAYHSAERLAEVTRAENVEVFQFLEDLAIGTQCFVAVRGRDVVIAFRGTEQLKDWNTDRKIRRTIWNQQKVHRGFACSYNSVNEKIIALLDDLNMARGNQGQSSIHIWITGHSLGGALATLCAQNLLEKGFDIAAVYTFGSPRVGDGKFSRAYNKNLKSRTFRLVNENDIVPRTPGVLMGYRHVGTEIYCDQFGDVRIDIPWWRKIPGDIWGFAKALDIELPPATAKKIITDHFMNSYLERLTA